MSPALSRALKVSGYIVTAILLAVIASPEFRVLIEDKPGLVALVPVINVVLAALAKIIEQYLPKDSAISKVL